MYIYQFCHAKHTIKEICTIYINAQNNYKKCAKTNLTPINNIKITIK